MENIETAILLMVVGMATVFVILLIVIYLGKLLITLSQQVCSRRSGSCQTGNAERSCAYSGEYLGCHYCGRECCDTR